jgi:Flp pilus assembly protein TadD
MRRGVVAACGLAALVSAVVLGWNDVRAERSFRRLVAQGDRAMAAGQTTVAVEAFSGAVVLKPQSMLPYLKRGDTYLHRQDWAAAERDLRQATMLDPTAPQPLERLGDVAAATGRLDEAEAFYRNSLSIEDQAPRVLYKLGLARYRSGDTAGAVSALDDSLRLDGSNPATHYVKGVVLAAAGNLDAARPAFEQAIELEPAAVEARLGLADLHAARGRDRDELALREAAAALDTTGPGGLLNVARAYTIKGRSDQAIATLTRAADQYAGSTAVQAALGRLWIDLADGSSNTAALARALALLAPMAAKPDASSETLTLYGHALLLDGSLTQAERVLERATLQYPIAPEAFGLLGEAAARRGHRAAADLARRKQAALGS